MLPGKCVKVTKLPGCRQGPAQCGQRDSVTDQIFPLVGQLNLQFNTHALPGSSGFQPRLGPLLLSLATRPLLWPLGSQPFLTPGLSWLIPTRNASVLCPLACPLLVSSSYLTQALTPRPRFLTGTLELSLIAPPSYISFFLCTAGDRSQHACTPDMLSYCTTQRAYFH